MPDYDIDHEDRAAFAMATLHRGRSRAIGFNGLPIVKQKDNWFCR